MNIALFCNLNFTVYINLKIRHSLAEIYVRSVYLNLFGLREREIREKNVKGSMHYKRLESSGIWY
jgi:hypothetical protein